MSSHPTLSVIIPLYNCETYISRCLDSILTQLPEDDFEVIIVDDGSQDDSYAIVSDYAAGHDNIRLLRQNHLGVACARNKAVSEAKGDYITFVDADDMIVAGSLEFLLQTAVANRAEMVKAVHHEVPQDAECSLYDRRQDHTFLRVMSGEEAVVEVTNLKEGYCWGYLISRRLVTDNGICFPPEVSFMEDWAFITQVLLKCRTFVLTDRLFYLYRNNAASCVANMSGEKLLSCCRAIDIVAKLAGQAEGAVRKRLFDNVCVNVNIVLWFTIHYRRIYSQRKAILRQLLILSGQVDRAYIPGQMRLFMLFPDVYVSVRYLLASRKY